MIIDKVIIDGTEYYQLPAERFAELAKSKYYLVKAEGQMILNEKIKADSAKAQMEFEEYKSAVDMARAANFRNRTYDFVSGVNERSVEECLDTLTRWNRQSNDTITIRFTSPGGEVIHGLSLFDGIRMIISDGTPVTTITTGQAASMAAVLLQAGTKRVVAKNAMFLIHEIESSNNQPKSVSEQKEANRFAERLNEKLFSILSERSSLTPTEIARRAKKTDWWLDASDCVKFRFADEILQTAHTPKASS